MFRTQIAWWKFFSGFACLSVVSATVFVVSPTFAQENALKGCFAFDRAACDKALATDPTNLTALFLRGLAADLDGDDAAALKDFDAVVAREPRHFGAQLWRHVAALSVGQTRATDLQAFLDQLKYETPGRMLAELYLGTKSAADILAAIPKPNPDFRQPHSAESEFYCAAQYHIGRLAYRAGHVDEAKAHFQAALETGSAHVFEYQAAERALKGMQ